MWACEDSFTLMPEGHKTITSEAQLRRPATARYQFSGLVQSGRQAAPKACT